jgi:Flp pilus assembly pilin Flp
MKLVSILKAFPSWEPQPEESGQTLVEYSMLIALVAIAAIVGITAVAGGVDSLWGHIANQAGDAIRNVLS